MTDDDGADEEVEEEDGGAAALGTQQIYGMVSSRGLSSCPGVGAQLLVSDVSD